MFFAIKQFYNVLRSRYVASIIFILIILIIFGRVALHPLTIFIGTPGDSQQFMWYLGWFWHAVFNGQNPFISMQVNYPSGINLMQNTSIIAEAIIFGPLIYLVNTTFTYNLMMAISIFTTAYIGFLLLGEIGIRYWLAVFGGILFEIMPYTWAQALGHANLVMSWPVFAVMLVVVRILKGKSKSPKVSGILAGIFLVIEFYTSLEVFTTFILIGGIAILLYMIVMGRLNKRNATPNIKILLIYTGISLFVFAIPGLLIYFFGPYRPNLDALVQPFGVYVNDLISFILPTPIYALHDKVTTFVSTFYTGNYSEDDGYLGIYTIILMILSAQSMWKSRFYRLILFVLLIVILLSMGPSLHILGNQTKLSLPWVLIQHIPILRDVLPSRLMLYGDILVVILIVSYFERLLLKKRPAVVLLLVILFVLFWWPSLPYPSTQVSSTVRTIEPEGILYNKLREKPTLVLSDNFPSVMQSLADGRYAFPVANIYGFQNDSPAMMAYQSIESLPSSSKSTAEKLIRGAILSTHVSRVLYITTDQQPIPKKILQTVNQICGLPDMPYPNVVLWNVPKKLNGMWFSGDIWDVNKLIAGSTAWAGTTWGIHSIGQKINIRVIAPPAALSPSGVRFYITYNRIHKWVYLKPSSSLNLTLDGEFNIQFTTENTFRPNIVIPGSADTRSLSALISVHILRSLK